MKILIEYCGQWIYEPRALRARDILGKRYEADVDLVESGGGVFEISVDGTLVFSKKKEGRFPSEQELTELEFRWIIFLIQVNMSKGWLKNSMPTIRCEADPIRLNYRLANALLKEEPG